jgi:hypothetical protein
MSLAAKLPYDHPYAGGYPGLSSQALPTDADALDYLARVKAADGAGVEVGVATAVDAFFKDAKELGVFSALKACCILAGARTLAGALVPVVGDAPTAYGFVEGDFDRFGLTGDGTSYLDSNRDVGADPQDDAHISVHLTAALQTNGYLAGRASATFTLLGQNLGIRTSALYATAAIGTGTWALARNASNEFFYMQNSGTPQSLEVASGSPGTGNLHVFKYNPSGAATANTLSFYSIGSSLGTDPADGLADLDTAVTNLITAIGNAL